MKRKILIAAVILLSAVLVLCLAYAVALRDAQDELQKNNSGKETVGTSAQTETAEGKATENTYCEGTLAPETESTEPNNTTEHMEPSQPSETKEIVTGETTAPASTETSESRDPDELPIVPNA